MWLRSHFLTRQNNCAISWHPRQTCSHPLPRVCSIASGFFQVSFCFGGTLYGTLFCWSPWQSSQGSGRKSLSPVLCTLCTFRGDQAPWLPPSPSYSFCTKAIAFGRIQDWDPSWCPDLKKQASCGYHQYQVYRHHSYYSTSYDSKRSASSFHSFPFRQGHRHQGSTLILCHF